MVPIQIKIVDKHLIIKWEGGTNSIIKLANIRRNCPCAICEAEREQQSDSYTPIYSDEQLSISNIQQVGNYAIAIYWKDNHNTGIYIFDELKKLEDNS